MNISTIDPVSDLFKAIGPAPRLQILLAIGEGDPCVCHLEAVLGWRQAYLSQHLMSLRKAGLLLTSRQGRNVHYRLNDPRLLELIRQAAGLQGVSLPGLSPSQECTCPSCSQEKVPHG